MIKKIILSAIALLMITIIGLLIWAATYPELAKMETPAGLPRGQSQYLTMRDGVKIAVEVWLPADLAANQQVPALINATRYSRKINASDMNLINRLAVRLGFVPADFARYIELNPEAAWVNEAGYAVVLVDARGSAASFGSRPIEWSPDEVADYGEIIEWISTQPWSNGSVGAWGTSYAGNTADLMASIGHPAFKATAPRFSDFDPLLGVGMPGGLRADGFLDLWSDYNASVDSEAQHAKVVDTDAGGKLLEQAIAEHNNPNIAQTMRAIEFKDDEFGQSGLTFEDISPYSMRQDFEQANVPMQVWVSWLDAATTDGALSRYLTFNTPQHVIIGAWSHGGGPSVDPFLPESIETEGIAGQMALIEVFEPQMAQVLEFFDCYLKEEASCQDTESSITYYTLNSGQWHTTTFWPPEGFAPQRWYFAQDNTLSTEAPTEDAAADEYAVDFTATTGKTNRWFTQFGASVDYTANRADADNKLLTYTSPPMPADTEITGSPVITLYVASTTEDGAFHVYLEDVAPDGRVTYITEGILRANQHLVSDAEPPYVELGPYHSFNRADSAPLVPGEVTEIALKLYATSVLIKQGHSLRVALAGADADTFARYPDTGSPVWTVQRNNVYPSRIDLPVKVH